MTEYRYTTVVDRDGKIVLPAPRPAEGTVVDVLITLHDECAYPQDLLGAAVSSLGFWDNPIDDEIWNAA